MPVTRDNFYDVIEHHAPDPTQQDCHQNLRAAAGAFINAILLNTPTCADQQAAIRHAREALFTANAAIALRGSI